MYPLLLHHTHIVTLLRSTHQLRKPFGLFAALLLSSSCATTADNKPLRDLASLQWQNRIIVAQTANPESTQQTLLDHNAALAERDIIWLLFADQQWYSNYSGGISDQLAANLAERYLHAPQQVVLIGKDGGIKSREPELDLPALFRLIDAMPMRQAEMKRQSLGNY